MCSLRTVFACVILTVTKTKCDLNENDIYQKISETLNYGLLWNLLDRIPTLQEGSMCAGDINIMKQDVLYKNRSYYVTEMLDSEGKPPGGILQGNNFWPGNYEECSNVQSRRVQEQNRVFEGNYCILNINMSALDKRMASVEIGTCFPDSCSSGEVHNLTIEVAQYIYNHSSVNLNIEWAACDNGRRWTKENTAALSVFAVLFCFVGVGTLIEMVFIYCDSPLNKKNNSIEVQRGIYDEPTERTGLLATSTNDRVTKQKENEVFKAQRCRILSSFSVITNTRHLLNTSTKDSHIKSVDGLRVLSMWWIILGNTFILIKNLIDNKSELKHLNERFPFLAVENATFAEDTFFLISGLLVAYLILKELETTGGKLKWSVFLVHRMVRLTPAYACVLLFYSALFIHTLSGPIELHLSNSKLFGAISSCYTKWWANLLYINNFYPNANIVRNQCLPWSWYLATTVQFYLISPFLIWFISRRKKFGLSIIGGLVVTCIFVRGLIILYYDMNYFTKAIGRHLSSEYGQHSPLYNKPYTRMAPFLIGMALGYVLHKTKRKVRLKKKWASVGWFVFAASGMLIVFGPYRYFNDSSDCSKATSVLYGSLSRPAWSIVVAWVVLMCSVGYGGPINMFLSLRLWTPLARLTFCTYLLHPIVIYYDLVNSGNLLHYTDVSFVWLYISNLVVSYGMAFALSLLVEMPVQRLEKLLYNRS